MSTAGLRYNKLVDQLREMRRDESHDTKNEASIFDEFELLWPQMSTKEQEAADQEGWRSWPDLFDKRANA